MARPVENLDEMMERERRYDAARSEWDAAQREGRKPSRECLEEMWATCLGPAKKRKIEQCK